MVEVINILNRDWNLSPSPSRKVELHDGLEFEYGNKGVYFKLFVENDELNLIIEDRNCTTYEDLYGEKPE